MSGDMNDPVGTRARASAMIQPQQDSGDMNDPVGTRTVTGIRQVGAASGDMNDPVGTRKSAAPKKNRVRRHRRSAKATKRRATSRRR